MEENQINQFLQVRTQSKKGSLTLQGISQYAENCDQILNSEKEQVEACSLDWINVFHYRCDDM